MSAVALLFFILPTLYSVLCLVGLESTYADGGMEVWSPQFQSTIAGRAIDYASEYRSRLQLNHGVILLWGLLLALLVTFFLGIVYRALCRARARKYFATVTIGLGLAWMLFLVAGTLYPPLVKV